MATSSISLDTLIVKATNPLVENPDPLDIATFCEKVNHEHDGPQIAAKLLAYRIHSPQEKEALNALSLLEQCVKSCGPSFHSEIGKFRFLNELIKLVSPKYQAHRTPIHVKQRILDIIYTWTIDLKSEPKILEAYDMLKKQGVIKENPNYLGTNGMPPTSPPPREKPVFCDNSEKDALLQKLLRSKNPEDLQAANRLIKSMVREEENRIEAASRRQLEIETVRSNIRLLEELLDNYEANGATTEEMELCTELASNCDRLRPNLSKIATETDDKGDGLAEILQTSDQLSQVLERFEKLKKTVSPPTAAAQSQPRSAALDLLDLGPVVQQESTSHNMLDDQLLSLGLDELPSPQAPINVLQPLKVESNGNASSYQRPPEVKSEVPPVPKPRGLEDLDILGEALLKQNLPGSSKLTSSFQKQPDRVPLNVLAKRKAEAEWASAQEVSSSNNLPRETTLSPMAPKPSIPIDFDLLMQNTPPTASKAPQQQNAGSLLDTSGDFLVRLSEPPPSQLTLTINKASSQDGDVSMLDAAVSNTESIGTNDDVQLLNTPPSENPPVAPSPAVAPSLADISLKFDEIKPGSSSPVSLLAQESGLNVNLYKASAQLPKNVSVFVVSATSRSTSPVTNFTFQAIVPKGNRVKLQTPSDNKLPPYNPFLPPPAITQVVLLSTPGLKSIELKYVVSFDVDGETTTEMGSINELVL